MEFTIRNAQVSDIDSIMKVEKDWPEDQRSTVDKFMSRLEIFPQGFFLAECDGEVVAVSTSTLTTYDENDLTPFKSWEHCTNDGLLYPLEDISNYNALYIVSNGIMVKARRSGIREAIIGSHIALAEKLKLKYVLTGAMIPGYNAFCEENGETAPYDYAVMESKHGLIDPTIRKLDSLGLILPSSGHIIENFYQSPESRDYGALLVHELPANKKAP